MSTYENGVGQCSLINNCSLKKCVVMVKETINSEKSVTLAVQHLEGSVKLFVSGLVQSYVTGTETNS